MPFLKKEQLNPDKQYAGIPIGANGDLMYYEIDSQGNAVEFCKRCGVPGHLQEWHLEKPAPSLEQRVANLEHKTEVLR